jgi:hypothetical protein
LVFVNLRGVEGGFPLEEAYYLKLSLCQGVEYLFKGFLCYFYIWFLTNIWSKDGLPKINILCWILSQGKIITGGILLKEVFRGPFIVIFVRKIWKQLIIYYWNVNSPNTYGNQCMWNCFIR